MSKHRQQFQSVVAEVDVIVAAFSRAEPDPATVQRWIALIDERRLFLTGSIRQHALALTVDERQMVRLSRALAAIPDLPVQSHDHVEAASLGQRLRQRKVVVPASQALTWSLLRRLGVALWTNEQRWWRLQPHGAPVWDHSR